MHGAGTHFTVRSASSPSYTLARRSGIRRRETAEAAGEQEKCGTSIGTNNSNNDGNERVKDQREKDVSGFRLTSELDQNGTADKTTLENSTDVGVNSAIERRGRTEWRSNLPSRSQSFEWTPRTRSPVQCPRTDSSMLSSKREADFRKNTGGSKERTALEINMTGRVASSLLKDSSPVNYSSLTLDEASKGKSLPSRFRSEYGPDSRFTETSFGPKGVQSIQERIQKLFESAGEKTTGGTFPRRFSTGDNCSPVQTRVSFIWPQKDANTSVSETVVCPEIQKPKGKSPMKPWRGSFSSKYSEDVNWSKDMMELGTKSLDRARSRNTVAAQINTLRATGEIFGTVQPKTISEYRTGQLKGLEKNKEKAEGAIKQNKPMSVLDDEDVFDTNPQMITLKPSEEKQLPLPDTVPSSASVRNKISRFEALTQKATNEVQTPRWTFHAPTQLYKARVGVKKSRSAREIRERGDKWEGENGRENCRKLVAERSFSVDEVGLRLEKMETEGRDSVDTGFSEDFDKYSRLKKTMHIPLDEGTQRRRRMFYFGPDKFENSSPEDSSKEEATSNSMPPPHPVPVQPQRAIRSPVSDDDQTPTNTPDGFSFIFSATQTEKALAVADSKNESTSFIMQEDEMVSPLLPVTSSHNNVSDVCTTQEEKTAETDFPSFLPVTISKRSTSDVFYPEAKTTYPKGKKQLLDLNTWVAGLSPEYKGWNEYIGHYEDDDDSTQKDDDSNYDSDSGDSSVTVTSNKSQSDRKSFSLSLAELCNFSGVEYESDTDADEWEQHNRRSASMSSDMSAFSCVSLMPAEELDKLLEDVKDLGDETLQEYDGIQVVVLHKEVGVGLGFSLAGGADQNKPITVHKVFPSGVAAQEGSIREGDQVLSINGNALCGNAHWEALRSLRRAKAREMVVVVLRKSDVSGAPQKIGQKNNERVAQTPQETGQRVCVQLQKNSRDLGFSLLGGVGSSEGNRPLTVQKIFQGGPVDQVFPGDEVLEIQRVSVLAMRRLEVWTFIRKLPSGPVEVVLHRPHKHQRP